MNTDPRPQPTSPSALTAELPKDHLFRVLSFDGGGAKGFYTLGVLKEIEGLLKCPLYERFDLVFGTSTAALVAFEVDQIHELYKRYVPEIMKCKRRSDKSRALEKTATAVFGDRKFDEVKTGIGINHFIVVLFSQIHNKSLLFPNSTSNPEDRVFFARAQRVVPCEHLTRLAPSVG